jgi:hypothetical protein
MRLGMSRCFVDAFIDAFDEIGRTDFNGLDEQRRLIVLGVVKRA